MPPQFHFYVQNIQINLKFAVLIYIVISFGIRNIAKPLEKTMVYEGIILLNKNYI